VTETNLGATNQTTTNAARLTLHGASGANILPAFAATQIGPVNVPAPQIAPYTGRTFPMSKELYIEAHDQLIGEYLDAHPDASDIEAMEATADKAYDRMTDMYADMIDQAKQRLKDEGNWPPKPRIIK
jgi:hypothetical protein